MNPDPTNLDRLHDILVPAPVPFWPPAPGWWWVIGAVAVLLLVLLLRAFSLWQRNRYRREALRALAALEPAVRDPARRAGALLELAGLLKRVAVTAYPRVQVARLTGAEWSSFLDRTAEGAAFSQGPGVVLQAAVSNPRTAASLDEPSIHELLQTARGWIRRHQPITSA